MSHFVISAQFFCEFNREIFIKSSNHRVKVTLKTEIVSQFY